VQVGRKRIDRWILGATSVVGADVAAASTRKPQ
jgi:hypothetical protein